MKCGSTRPVAIRTSASTKRRSIETGVPRVGVTPRSTWESASRATWLATTTVSDHPRVADDLGEFESLVRAMQSRRHEHRDGLGCDAGIEQRPDEMGEEQTVRYRTRDVADQDAGAAGPLGVGQRDRTDWSGEGLGDRGCRVGEDPHWTLGDDRDVEVVRHADRQRAAAVVQPELHVRHRTPGAAPACPTRRRQGDRCRTT